jgi:hypothetical protein
MGRVKDWMMDMEESVVDAVNLGAKTQNDVVSYVKTNMAMVDETFVRKFTQQLCGECEPLEVKDEPLDDNIPWDWY